MHLGGVNGSLGSNLESGPGLPTSRLWCLSPHMLRVLRMRGAMCDQPSQSWTRLNKNLHKDDETPGHDTDRG